MKTLLNILAATLIYTAACLALYHALTWYEKDEADLIRRGIQNPATAILPLTP